MKKIRLYCLFGLLAGLFSCNDPKQNANASANNDVNANAAATAGGQENVLDSDSQKDVVKVAVGSKDHSTLVAALKQAELVTSLSNAGPFTVFAPTNEAFNKIPKETLDALMKDEKKSELQDILEYHVTVSSMKAESFTDGQQLGMVNGGNILVSVKDGKVMLNNHATIIASVPASNGMIHIIDAVLLPEAKK
jgi:uncharacterized surface protein with fasciclin (FAS1) repeats